MTILIHIQENQVNLGLQWKSRIYQKEHHSVFPQSEHP